MLWLEGTAARDPAITASVAGMSALLDELYGDELDVLGSDRRSHSLAVGRKVAAFAHLVVASARSDLVAAATLHDIGYGHSATGFHPVDGARYLAKSGFSTVVCNLVVHHSASRVEAQERGIDQVVFHEFEVEQDLGPHMRSCGGRT